MLKLRNVCKKYKNGKEERVILDNINLDFKKKELVFILGASGSGKSTLLNIIGGNLKPSSGSVLLDDLVVNRFNERQLNKYRNKIVGNVFQDYNLIDYMNVWDNIMLGYSGGINKVRINTLLKQLGIHDKKRVRVSKLSGGERQRVAIARALVNDPAIVLADEPTGALDSKTGVEVMDILKRVSKNRLVIVVSHDEVKARKYADRIIEIKDGKCEYEKLDEDDNFINKRQVTHKKFSIRKMALSNLFLKKGRTLITSLAISLGIVSMIVVLTLSMNFSKEITLLEKSIVSSFPITVSNGEFLKDTVEELSSREEIIIKRKGDYVVENKINQEYIDYLEKIDEIKYMTTWYDISMPVISDKYKRIDNSDMRMVGGSNFIEENYDLLAGSMILGDNEVLLKVDSNNNVSSDILNAFGIDSDINYSSIIGRRVKIIDNDNYYQEVGNGYYKVVSDNQELYDKSLFELVIVGVVREKEVVEDDGAILYQSGVIDYLLRKNKDSQIVKSQLNSQENVLGQDIDRNEMLGYLGYNSLPSLINIYVDSLEDKEEVTRKLDLYNEEHDKLIYIDTMASAIEIVRNFVKIISVVLIAFSGVAIIISMMMVFVLTNVRVLERKKEIGILRSLGASKRSIVRLFNMENVLIGLIASGIGIGMVYFINGWLDKLLYNLLEIDGIFNMSLSVITLVVLFNILIILIAGVIPAKRASRLEIVNCIYDR